VSERQIFLHDSQINYIPTPIHHNMASEPPDPPIMPIPKPSALKFDLLAKCSVTKARAAILHLPHGPVPLPIFMPVATQASLKGLTPEQLADTGCKLCLNNTYHLGLKPGQEVLEKIGGAHRLQAWEGNLLTDSGGLVISAFPFLVTY
jgi:tRNA-guanine family transglycosylase